MVLEVEVLHMNHWISILDDMIDSIIGEETYLKKQLPSEHFLVEKYGVTRHDVRKVFERLTDMGYIYSIRGKGRYYKSKHDKIDLLLTGDRSFTEKMKEKGHTLETINIHFKPLEKAASLREQLKLKREHHLFKITRLRIVNGEPAALHISYISNKVFKNIAQDGANITSMFEYFRHHGFYDYYSKQSDLQTMLPTRIERELLKCPSLVPVMILDSQCFDRISHEILEITKIIYRGDRFICRLKSDEY